MTVRNEVARAAAAALLAADPTIGPRALAAALSLSPSTAHAILQDLRTMPTPAPSLDAVVGILPTTPTPAPVATADDASAAADAQLAAAMAAVEAARQAKARAAEAAAKAKAEAEAAEAARVREAAAREQAAAAARAAVAQQQRPAPVPTLAQVAAAAPTASDLPPIVSRWTFPIPPSMGKGWIGRKQELALLADWISQPDGPCGLTGPKGSGKTALLREAAARAGRAFLRVNGHRDMVASDLIGSWVTRADRTLAWSDGPLPAAMRAGACLLIDEWDRIPSGTTSVAQAVMEGDDLTIPETGERISPAPGFCIAASANSIGDRSGGYSATMPVDAATLDRFGILLRVDPMGKADLRRLIKAHIPACGDTHREAALLYHLELCQSAEKGDLSEVPSPRRLLALCRWVSRGIDPALAVAATYADRLDATEGEAVRALASRMVTPDAALLAAAIAEAQADLAAQTGGAA